MVTLTPVPITTPIKGSIATPFITEVEFQTDIAVGSTGLDLSFWIGNVFSIGVGYGVGDNPSDPYSPEWSFSIIGTATVNTWLPCVFGGAYFIENNKQVYKAEHYIYDSGGNYLIRLRLKFVTETGSPIIQNFQAENALRLEDNLPFSSYRNPGFNYLTRLRCFDFSDRVFTQASVFAPTDLLYYDDANYNDAEFDIETALATYDSSEGELPFFDDFKIGCSLFGNGTEVFSDWGIALIRRDTSDNNVFFLTSFEAVFLNNDGSWLTDSELQPDYIANITTPVYGGLAWNFTVDIPAKSLPLGSEWQIISYWKGTGLYWGNDGYEAHISRIMTVNRCPDFTKPTLTTNDISDYTNTFPANIIGAPRERFRSQIRVEGDGLNPNLNFYLSLVRVIARAFRVDTNNQYDFFINTAIVKNQTTGLFASVNGLSAVESGGGWDIAYDFRAQFGATPNLYTTDFDTNVTNTPGTSTREWTGRDIELFFELTYSAVTTDTDGNTIIVNAVTTVPQLISVKPYDVSELALRAGVNTDGVINKRAVICANDPNFCFQVTSPDEPFTEWFLAGIDVVGATDATIKEEETFAGVLTQLGNATLTDISQQYTLVDGVKRATGCIDRAFLNVGTTYELTAIRKRAADPTPPVVDCVTCGLRGVGTVGYPFIAPYVMPTDFTVEIKFCLQNQNDGGFEWHIGDTLNIDEGNAWLVRYANETKQFGVSIGKGVVDGFSQAVTQLPFPLRGASYHAIYVVRGLGTGFSSNDWEFYINGAFTEKIAGFTFGYYSGTQLTNSLELIPQQNTTVAFARIYNRALTPAEITALYNDNDAQTPATVGIAPADIILDTTFDELSGTVAPDDSPNLNDGTLTGWSALQTDAGGGAWTCPVQAVICTADVPSGYCGLQFVDTGVNTPYVDFDGTGMNFGAADFTVTYELSFDPCYYDSLQLGVYTDGASEFLSSIYVESGDLRVGFRLLDNIGITEVFTTLCRPECTNNDAYLSVAFVRSGDDGTAWEIYVNGQPTQIVINDNTYGGTGLTTVTNLFARSFLTEINPPVISNLRVYDRVLTPTEIAEQYATRNVPTGATGNVVYDIPFSEFQGTVAADVSGNGYDGTLVGFGSSTYQNGGAWTCPASVVQQPIPNAVCDTVCGLKILNSPAQSINFPQTGVENYNNNPVTINGWYKSEATDSQGIVAIRLGSTTPSPFIEVQLRANAVKVRYFRTSATTQTEVNFQFPTPTGTCYHFAAIVGETRKANQFRLFINGVQVVVSNVLQDDAPAFDLFNIGLGGLEVTQDNPNLGSYAIIRNLSIDDFALTEAQIQRIYNGGVPAEKGGGAYILNTSFPDLTIDGYQVFLGNQYAPRMFGAPFTEFEGLNAEDITQNGNDGTLNNYSAGEVAYGGGAWGCAPVIPECPAACGVNLFFPPSPPNPYAPKSIISANSSTYYGGGNFTVMGRVNGLLNDSFGLTVNAGCFLALKRSNLSYGASFTPFDESKFLGFQNPKDCYHVAVVRERQNGINRLTIYRDNEKWVFEMNNVSGGGAKFFQFNHENFGNNTGVIASDWRFFDRPLTEIEVRAIMMLTPNTPLSTSLEPNIITAETDLVLEYLFNQTSGATALDTSGGGNNGTLSGYTPAELLLGGGAWTCP